VLTVARFDQNQQKGRQNSNNRNFSLGPKQKNSIFMIGKIETFHSKPIHVSSLHYSWDHINLAFLASDSIIIKVKNDKSFSNGLTY
jgi:hypothetical protein